jgi:hypothetical protein
MCSLNVLHKDNLYQDFKLQQKLNTGYISALPEEANNTYFVTDKTCKDVTTENDSNDDRGYSLNKSIRCKRYK